MPTLSQVVRGYVGTPFEHQARRPGHGIDCVGLVVCGLTELGYYIRDFRAYGGDSDPVLLLSYVREFFDTVPIGQQQPDDVLMFWTVDPTKPQHVAVFSGTTIIHAFPGRARPGKVREEPVLASRMANLYGAFRFRGSA